MIKTKQSGKVKTKSCDLMESTFSDSILVTQRLLPYTSDFRQRFISHLRNSQHKQFDLIRLTIS